MSTKADSAVLKAAKAVKVAKHTGTSHSANSLKADVARQVAFVTGLTVNTVALVLMVVVTLAANAFLHDYVFVWFHTDPEDVSVWFFKVAKLAALGLELAFWVHGVYKACLRHAQH